MKAITLVSLFLFCAGSLYAQNPPQNLTTTVNGSDVALSWDPPEAEEPQDRGEAMLGTDGGTIRVPSGNIEFTVPPGGLPSDTRVRVTSIPIDTFEEEVRNREIPPVGIPIDRAGVLEIEAERLTLPAVVQVRTPAGITSADTVVFAQLINEGVRFWGEGTLSVDGMMISAPVPINAGDGLSRADPGGRPTFKSQVPFLNEIQANGIDDDGDGLIDEMELYFYPDLVVTGLCTVSGSVFYEDGAPATGAFVSIQGSNGLPVSSIADDFGNYTLPIQAPQAPGRATFTVSASDGMGVPGTASGECSLGESTLVNVVIGRNTGSGIGVTITSPTDNEEVNSNVISIQGTVSDPTVTNVEILLSGIYPPVIGTVNNGTFNVAVLLPDVFVHIVVLARNPEGGVGAASVVVRVADGVLEPPDLQISLQWNKDNDMDLHVLTPTGSVINFRNSSAGGGTLNIDQQSGTASGPEVVSFPMGQAQPGRYAVAVHFWTARGLGATEATVSIFAAGRTLGTFTQTLTESGSLGSATTLADVDPTGSVWSVRSVTMPSGTLGGAVALTEFVIGEAAGKFELEKDPHPYTFDAPRPDWFTIPDPGFKSEPRVVLDERISRQMPDEEMLFNRPSSKIAATTLQVDEIEPNNNEAEAQILAGDSPLVVNGNVEVADDGTLSITLQDGSQDDFEDLYKVTTTAPGLKVNLDNFDSDLDLYLINEEATETVDNGTSTLIGAGVAEEVDLPNLAAGTYIIAVSIYDPDPAGPDSTAYELTVTGAIESSSEGPGGLQQYRIYRSTTAGAQANGALVATVGGNTTGYTDRNLPGGSYFYQVTALFDTGESPPSNEVNSQVVSQNSQPVVVTPIGDVDLLVGGANFTQDLSGVFSDPDGDPLSYSASSSEPTVAGTLIAGGVLNVVPLAVGSSVISVTAEDGQGGSVTTEFNASIPSGVASETETLPTRFELKQNYPNPFNPETLIGFDIAQTETVRLEIYNLMGQSVRTLVAGARPAGRYSVRWDGRNYSGDPVPTGMYVYRLQTDTFDQSRTMMLVR